MSAEEGDVNMEESPELTPDEYPQRWRQLNKFTKRQGPSCNNELWNPELSHESVKILVVGAGGLGCEILKGLALSGFRDIEVIDLDTIDLSNLNRQFLFRQADIGKPKAEVAARFVMERVPGVQIKAHFGPIEEKPDTFYMQFNIIILGLDSLHARRWMNDKVAELIIWDDQGEEFAVADESSIIPLIDGGTEGFKGHVRVIKPPKTASFAETTWMFPPQVKFPMCTIETTPRLPEHCVAYIKEVVWGKEDPFGKDIKLDGDNTEHVLWITKRAEERAAQFNIKGVDYRFTQGVVKNIIPAIASTNAIVAAACCNEALKMATACSDNLNNYSMYNGSSVDGGVYVEKFALLPTGEDWALSAPRIIEIEKDVTVQQFLDNLKGLKARNGATITDSNLIMLATPSKVIRTTGPLAFTTDGNLNSPLLDFVEVEDPFDLLRVTTPEFDDANLYERIKLRLKE